MVIKKNDKYLLYIVICVSIIGIITYCRCQFIQIRNMWNYPVEYRDSTFFKLVREFANGNNPYSLRYMLSDNPPLVCDSGFLNVFLAVLICRYFHIPASASLWVSNIVFICISLICLCKAYDNLTYNRGLFSNRLLEKSLLVFWSVFFFQRGNSILVTRPDIFCICILMIIICIYTQKQGGKFSIDIIAGGLVSLLIMSKIHYASIALTIVIYYILKYKKYSLSRIMRFGISATIMTVLFVTMSNILFPTYLSEWVPRLVQDVGVAGKITMNKVLRIITEYYSDLVIRLFPAVLIWTYIVYKKSKGEAKKPFLSFEVNGELFLFINIIVNVLCLFYLGGFMAGGGWYFYVMLVPSLILISVTMLNKISKSSNCIYLLACLLIVVSSWINMQDILAHTKRSYGMSANAKEVYEFMDKYDGRLIYTSPALSGYCIEKDMECYNYGDAVYIVDYDGYQKIKQKYTFYPLIEKIFPYTLDIYKKHEKYGEKILDRLCKSEYSVVAIDQIDGIPYYINDDFKIYLSEKYSLVDIKQMQYDNHDCLIQIWVPNEEK